MDQVLKEPVKIRLIERDDINSVKELITAVMQQFSCVGEGYSINDPEVQDMFTAYADDRSEFYVIEDRNKILGCGGIAPLKGGEAHICELRKMYFYKTLRGKGYGKKLLTFLIQRAQANGYTQMYLETVERMTTANMLYQKNGFIAKSSQKGNTGHSACDTYYLKDI